MRPIKLEMQGFTSFKQHCELLFSGLDLFAITGPTGAGKSSLLDAMTYALFGRTARLGKAGTGELVSQGSTSMSVALEFRVSKETYRVHRGIRGGVSKGRLDKWSLEGTWVAETGSIKEMDAAVRQLVGLDFDGFTRAVILPQGQFDQFLRGDKTERRKVLTDLLNFQYLDTMKHRANQKAQEFQFEMQTLASHIDESITEDTRKQLEKAIAGLEAERAEQGTLIGKLEKCGAIAQELSDHRTKQHHHQEDLNDAEVQAGHLKTSLDEHQTVLNEKRTGLCSIESEIAVVAYSENDHLRLAELVPRVERLESSRLRLAEHKQKRVGLEREIESNAAGLDQANSVLAVAAEGAKSDEDKFEAAKQSRDALHARYGLPAAVRAFAPEIRQLPEQQRQLTTVQAEIDEKQKILSTKAEVLRELTAAVQEAESSRLVAEQHLEELRAKNTASELRHNLRPGEPCPVCEQTVTAVPPAVIAADLDTARQALKVAGEKLKQAQSRFDKAPADFQLHESDLARKIDQRQTLKNSIANVAEKARTMLDAEPGPESLLRLEQLAASIEQAQAEVGRWEKQVKSSREKESRCRREAESLEQQCRYDRQRLVELSEQMQQLQAEIDEAGQKLTGVAELAVLKKQLKDLDQAKKDKDTLERRRREAETAVTAVEKEIADIEGRFNSEIKRVQKLKKELDRAAKDVETAERRLDKAVSPLELAAGHEIEELKQQLKRVNDRLRDLESSCREEQVRLATVVDKLKKNQELRERCTQLKKSAAVYHELGTLLSAHNFQDYMLRSSYKLLAREGSRYFEELTGGRYSFRADEDQFAICDHSNGDDLRSASTLSGGESFLASLSLALALAQSIAGFSGQHGAVVLESLFLDEGFSTLDPETLGKVADALPALQKKGRLIGVITHIEALAEQLPSRIEIAKTPTGSYIVQPRVALEVAATTA